MIFGDSGCGKSWLYKKVINDLRIFTCTLDFSASTTGDDVDLQILDLVAEFEEWKPSSKETTTDAGIKPSGMGVNTAKKTTVVRKEQSALNQLLGHMRAAAGKRKKAFLVLENIEHILDRPEVVSRIQNMLLALDDPQLGKHRVKLCLVGVPAEIKEVLTAGNKYQTISNRVVEIPEVDRLSKESVALLVVRGLEQQLDFTLQPKAFCVSQISYYSDRIPQYVHDLCLHAALLAEDNVLRIDPELVLEVSVNWIESNARQSYEFICDSLEANGPMSQNVGRVV